MWNKCEYIYITFRKYLKYNMLAVKYPKNYTITDPITCVTTLLMIP